MKSFSGLALMSLVLALGSDAHGHHSPKDCCTALAGEKKLRGKVWTPSDSQYDERLAQYYSLNAAQAPWCMVVPEDTKDVSEIMKIISRNECPFGMRSGGHGAFEGSNSIKDGVTIDLGYMNSTTYDKRQEVARIQPGATWGSAFTALAPYNVVAVGGRATPVGVGGFTTGGGYSFHTGVRGFACDNIRSFEVVLGDGRVVRADEKHHSELWKALKGGSGNFGIVTEFEAEVVPSAIIDASLAVYLNDKAPQLLQSYYDFVNRWHEEPESQIVLAKSFMGGMWVVGAISSNVGGKDTSAFDSFLNIDALQRVPAKGPASEVVPLFSESTPNGQFANWQTGTVAHDTEMLAVMDSIAEEYVAQMVEAVGTTAFEVIFQLQPVTKEVVNIMNSRGGNIMGLEAVVANGAVNMYNIVLTVKTAADQDGILPIAFAMNKAIQDKATELGHNRNWVFPNYAHGSQNPMSHYGSENIALMKSVSEKYDRQGVFQKLRGTGFHLP